MYNYNLPALIGNQYINLCPLMKTSEQEKGYQLISEKPNEEQGLLFIYNKEEPRLFHMNNVEFDLELLGFNSEKRLIFSIPMKSNSEKKYKTLPCKFAIEVQKNWSKNLLIGVSKLIF